MIEAVSVVAAEGSNLTRNVILAVLILAAIILLILSAVMSRRKKAQNKPNQAHVRPDRSNLDR